MNNKISNIVIDKSYSGKIFIKNICKDHFLQRSFSSPVLLSVVESMDALKRISTCWDKSYKFKNPKSQKTAFCDF